MKADFYETVKQKTDKELEIIAKDYVFYSEEERLIALNELEVRNNITDELLISKKTIEYSKEMDEEDKIPTHKINFKDLLPQKNYFFTPLLIYANVFVFVLMALFGMNIFLPSTDTLVQWGGNIRYLSINGQIWRLFTSVFLHGGILHLVFNMYALLYVGSILEKVIGKNKFIFAYIISGIVASISSIMMNENIVSIGASGAIFGLFGLLLPLRGYNFPNISVKKLLLNVAIFVLYNIMIGFTKSGIDNAAHIGGLFTGIIIGIFYSFIAKEKIRPISAYIILALIFGMFSTLVITNVSDNIGKYDRALKQFDMNEQKALWMYQVNWDNVSDMQLISFKNKLMKEGVEIWDENIILLEKIKNNDYDEWHIQLIDLLIDYSILRKKSCELMIALLEENDWENEEKLEYIHIDIENKLNEIKNMNP